MASLFVFEEAIDASFDSSPSACRMAALDGAGFGRNLLPVLETLNEIPIPIGISTNCRLRSQKLESSEELHTVHV